MYSVAYPGMVFQRYEISVMELYENGSLKILKGGVATREKDNQPMAFTFTHLSRGATYNISVRRYIRNARHSSPVKIVFGEYRWCVEAVPMVIAQGNRQKI